MDRYRSGRVWRASHDAAMAAFEEMSALIQRGGRPTPEQVDEVLHLRLKAKQKLGRMVDDVQSWTPVADDPR
jgi:hypothetical protein